MDNTTRTAHSAVNEPALFIVNPLKKKSPISVDQSKDIECILVIAEWNKKTKNLMRKEKKMLLRSATMYDFRVEEILLF